MALHINAISSWIFFVTIFLIRLPRFYPVTSTIVVVDTLSSTLFGFGGRGIQNLFRLLSVRLLVLLRAVCSSSDGGLQRKYLCNVVASGPLRGELHSYNEVPVVPHPNAVRLSREVGRDVQLHTGGYPVIR
jgi:hypothetical protein